MEEDLIIKYFKGENELKDKILNNYKELIINIATNYICTNIELDDLITEGYIALYNALDKYHYNKNNKYNFKDYLKVLVKDNILNYIYNNSYKVYLTNYLIINSKRPSNDEILRYLNIDINILKELESLELNDLNKVVIDNEFILDKQTSYKDTDSYLKDLSLITYLKNNLSNLEYYIIYYLYLVNNKKTKEELSKILGLHVNRITQIQKKTLTKIKRYLDTTIPVTLNYSKGDLYPIEYIKNIILIYLEDKLSSIEYLYAYYSYYLNYNEELLEKTFNKLKINYNKEKLHEINSILEQCLNNYEIVLKEVRKKRTGENISNETFKYIIYLKKSNL